MRLLRGVIAFLTSSFDDPQQNNSPIPSVLHVAHCVSQAKITIKHTLHRWSRARPCSQTLAHAWTGQCVCIDLYKAGVSGGGRELALACRSKGEALGDEMPTGYLGCSG